MISKQHAKIDNHQYNRRVDGSDSDATITDDVDNDDNDVDTHAPTSPYSVLPSDEDRETIINNALDELAVVARENILEFKREDFNTEEIVGTWIDSYLCQYFSEINGHMSNFSSTTEAEADALNDVTDAYIRELYDDISERFYEEIAPPRVSPATHPIIRDADAVDCFTEQIRILREKPQPEQRTPEWYSRRNNLITASAASKAFGTQASVNQLIYEKCKKYCASEEDGGGGGGGSNGPMQGSVNSPLHWGQRYEPLTVMVYEYRNRTKLGEFGCIQHDKYPFIGASPDGINIDPTSPIYGRMVEIKNIFNREITGHPKEEYWIQTQIQMEVCGLDECDFVETRFKEYDDEEEYLAATATATDANEKGFILWFQSAPALTQQGCVSSPIQLYEYAPIGLTAAEYDKWESEMFAKHERLKSIWVRTIYWYLDEYSCVLVKRNRLWFEEAVRILQDVWATIEEERQTGYEHRAPKRKTAAAGVAHSGSSGGGGGGGSGGGGGEFFKIVKLDNAIIPPTTTTNTQPTDNITPPIAATTEFTATNMATLMLINDINTNKKHSVKRPSDVLINCFKIDELEIDESKVKQ
jgi:putative phage-type endonuclease